MTDAQDTAKGATAPFRIEFKGILHQSFDELYANISANTARPHIQHELAKERPLAIVGGGPSVLEHLETLRNWTGDIWAINRTVQWLAENGIEAKLVSVDADTDTTNWPDPKHVKSALFSSWCSPSIIDFYPNHQIFHMAPLVNGGIHGGSTTAVSMPLVALTLGYSDITYFGCESSFVDQDHAYLDEGRQDQLIVGANGAHYRTTPALLVQAQELSFVLSNAYEVFKEECGGLLRAMIADKDWSIVAVSEALKDHLEAVNGPMGLYENKYEWSPNEHLSETP